MAILIRRDPFRDLLDIERNVSRILEDYGASGESVQESIVMPNIDVMNQGDDLVIHAEMPGIDPQDLDISLSGGMLTLRGERTQETERSENDYVMRERSWGTFERTIQLPGHVTAEQIEAHYNDGVLEVLVHEGAQGKQPQRAQIPVQTQGGQQGRQMQLEDPQQDQQGSQQTQSREQMREKVRSEGQPGPQGQSPQQGQSAQQGQQGRQEKPDQPSSTVGGTQSGIGNR